MIVSSKLNKSNDTNYFKRIDIVENIYFVVCTNNIIEQFILYKVKNRNLLIDKTCSKERFKFAKLG